MTRPTCHRCGGRVAAVSRQSRLTCSCCRRQITLEAKARRRRARHHHGGDVRVTQFDRAGGHIRTKPHSRGGASA